MKVSQLEWLYKDGMGRLKEQKKRQEQERLEQSVRRAVQEQRTLYEKKLQDVETEREKELQETKAAYERKLQAAREVSEKGQAEAREAQSRELRLVEEELERITDQAGSLRRHMQELLGQEKE